MTDRIAILAEELAIAPWQVQNTLKLFDEGGTVPFVARYRKEQTGKLDEVVLRTLLAQHTYLAALDKRKAAILQSIGEQGKLTDALRTQIHACRQKAALEDLYLPYKPRKRTRATKAREKGLEPLALWLQGMNRPDARAASFEAEARKYIDAERGVATVEEALQGASDILAEGVAEKAELRTYVRRALYEHGVFAASIGAKHKEGTTNYEMYREYRAPVKKIPAHNLLALFRGEEEDVVDVVLTIDEERILQHLFRREIYTRNPAGQAFFQAMVTDAFRRLMKKTLSAETRRNAKERADQTSISTFAANLRELLLASPAGMRPTIGIDPGFRTGCKVAVLEGTGKLLTYRTIFPHQSAPEREKAASQLAGMIRTHQIELLAVGNGTAGRETSAFVGEVVAGLKAASIKTMPITVMVSEAGASVYSASEVAIAEFPDLDVTVRGAVSIGRRLQDPLAELVKIDPKSIGVGQYQHDVDQAQLHQALEETVESCVNYVGVDVNTASSSLLRFVAGIPPALAKNIVAHRDVHGAFADRRALLKVSRFGPKAFEQAAGFLRIRQGRNPLDNTAVHPESYHLVQRMAGDLGLPLQAMPRNPDRLQVLDLKHYQSDTVGLPTLRDILAELKKPGRDPREQFRYATFREDVQTINDLTEGMTLEGVVTNVTNFGAFVDIGVHRDGLVHVSQLADRYVRDPHEVVKVGLVVTVRVIEVDTDRGRISLSMRAEPGARPQSTPPA